MNDYTNYYYTLSTIPQVLAAFLGLSSIFLIYSYGQIKSEILTIAHSIEKQLNIVMHYNNKNLERVRVFLGRGFNTKSVTMVITSLKDLFIKENEEFFKTLIKDRLEENELLVDKFQGISDYIFKDTYDYSKALLRSARRLNMWVRLAFFFGVPTIIVSYVLIQFIPVLNECYLQAFINILFVTSSLSIFFLVLTVWDYLDRAKREFKDNL